MGSKLNPVARLGIRARRGFGRIVPEPFAIAVVLTIGVMVAARIFGHPLPAIITDWVSPDGLWSLLQFTMQMALMLMLGTALASAPAIRSGLSRIVAWAPTPRLLVGLTALLAIALAILNWSLGIIGGALVAREAGNVAERRGWKLHYPLLCAAGYAGLMTWHGGFSGSAPLKVTTEKDMIEVLGKELAATVGTIPIDQTLFGTLNLVVTGGLLVLGPLLFMALTPASGADPDPRPAPAAVPTARDDERATPADGVERFERAPIIVWLLVLPMAYGLALSFAGGGWARLDFNAVNLILWCAALLAHGRPSRFLRACEDGVRSCTGVLLQFPLYAGIMGVMAGSGLSAALTNLVTGVGADAFVVVAFLSAGLLNLLVPSGGGQWAVQGPILMEGALTLGLEPADVVMAMAYGDQWTNMLQPFWALPLLALTGVRARDIVGYTALWMVVGGAFIVAALVTLV